MSSLSGLFFFVVICLHRTFPPSTEGELPARPASAGDKRGVCFSGVCRQLVASRQRDHQGGESQLCCGDMGHPWGRPRHRLRRHAAGRKQPRPLVCSEEVTGSHTVQFQTEGVIESLKPPPAWVPFVSPGISTTSTTHILESLYKTQTFFQSPPCSLSLPCGASNRMCACSDSSRKSTPPHAPVHYGTWRKRRSTSCTSSPSACLGRVLWASRCASAHRRRPRLRPPRVKVKKKKNVLTAPMNVTCWVKVQMRYLDILREKGGSLGCSAVC